MNQERLQTLIQIAVESIWIEREVGEPPNTHMVTYIPWDQFAQSVWSKAIFISKGKNLYWFNGLWYDFVKPEYFRDCINFVAMLKPLAEKNKYSIARGNEIYTQVLDHTQIPSDRMLDEEEEYILFDNGFLSTKTATFIPDTEIQFAFDKYYFTKAIPLEYTPECNPVGFKLVMEKLFPDEADRREVLIFLAYTMIPMRNNLRYHQIWYGGGNNGKTQLAEHWGDLLGDSTARIALNALLSDTHAMVGLRGKNLNISSEIKGVMLGVTALDRFKSMLTDPYLSCRDVFESQSNAQYPNKMRLLGTANDLPYSEYMEDDKALFSRFKLKQIKYEWNDLDWEQWKDEDGTYKHVFDKIFKAEGPQILSYVASFRFFLNELTIDWEDTQKIWISAGNSAIAFMHCPGIGDDHDSIKRKLYDDYLDWCKRNNRKKLNYQTFFKTLKHRGYTEISRKNLEGDTEKLIEAFCYSEKRDMQHLTQTILQKIK